MEIEEIVMSQHQNHHKSMKYRKSPSQLCYLLGMQYTRWHLNRPATRRLTPFQVCKHVTQEVRAYFPKTLTTVWDIFSNVGSDSVCFAKHFDKVLCSESDPVISEICKNNLREQAIGNIEFLPLTQELEAFTQQNDLRPDSTLIYLNPPWGNSYDRNRKPEFHLEDVRLLDGKKFSETFELLRSLGYPLVVVVPTEAQSFATLFPADRVVKFSLLSFLFYVKKEINNT